jgi:hypothetical protein
MVYFEFNVRCYQLRTQALRSNARTSLERYLAGTKRGPARYERQNEEPGYEVEMLPVSSMRCSKRVIDINITEL